MNPDSPRFESSTGVQGPLAPLVIVGPTASGKSALAVELALLVGGLGAVEIVSADAMAVYRGMDVGTAKPPIAERRGIVHHLLDVADPAEEYTVARFQEEAKQAIASIEARGGLPIVVGGTGLYVRSVVDDFTMPGRYPEVREVIEDEPATSKLWARLDELDPVAAAKMLPTNRRRIVRALEVTIGSGLPFSSFGPGVDRYPPTRFRQAGLLLDRGELDRRIDARYSDQLAAGFLDETIEISKGELSRSAGQALGYREMLDHLAGSCSLEEALEVARRRTKRFARRQERWFRRDPRINWFEALDNDLVTQVRDWWTGADEEAGQPSGENPS